jgi:predicted O-methyltransferase YrrM
MKRHLANIQGDIPTVLEVGVDRGVSLIPLAAFLARTREAFFLIGIDVMVQEQMAITMRNLDLQGSQQAYLIQDSSLNVLPTFVEQDIKFDLVLLDGDHNYHTVSKELTYLSEIVKPNGIVIIDDYDGRWADRDLWYAEREGYENVAAATKKVDTEKHGVKTAVDEYLAAHPEWKTKKLFEGEPILLSRADI